MMLIHATLPSAALAISLTASQPIPELTPTVLSPSPGLSWMRNEPSPPAQETPLPLHLAHALLVKASPDKESTVTDAPQEVLLTFNEGVGTEFLALAVVDSSGQRVDQHDARLLSDRSKLQASVARLTSGRYLVRYRVLSADGHVVSGKYYFTVRQP